MVRIATHTHCELINFTLFVLQERLMVDSSIGKYSSALHTFLSLLSENLLLFCQLLIDASSIRFYALTTEQLSQFLYTICTDMQTLPDYRVLCILRILYLQPDFIFMAILNILILSLQWLYLIMHWSYCLKLEGSSGTTIKFATSNQCSEPLSHYYPNSQLRQAWSFEENGISQTLCGGLLC